MKILILKPSSLGDVVHALPVLRMLKRHWPASDIYWWIRSDLAPLLENDPDLSGLFLFRREAWRQLSRFKRMLQNIRIMRRKRFDLILDLQGLSRSAVCGWLAQGETFIGLNNTREGAQLFYDVSGPRTPYDISATDRYLSLLPMLGVPVRWDFEWLPVRPEAAAKVRAQAQPRSGRWIALLPGARWDNKRWPAEHFAATVKLLAAQDSTLNFAILGTKSDGTLAETITRANPERCLDLTGQTSMSEMIEWLRLADAVVANDTGTLHVAVALQRPLVAIYGPTNPKRTGPYGQLDRVLQASDLECVPCMKSVCTYREPLACLHRITPEMVCTRVTDLLISPKK